MFVGGSIGRRSGRGSAVGSLIDHEGGYVNHPPTRAGQPASESPRRSPGLTAAPAPCANCHAAEAAAIYRRIYWLRPRLDEIAKRSPRLAAELFDIGVNDIAVKLA